MPVREQPDPNAAKIGTLLFNDSANVTGITDTGWYRISYDGKTGYCSGNYLADEKQLLDKGIPETSDLNKLLDDYFDKNPENVKKAFEKDGWKIILTDKDLNEIFTGDSGVSDIAGITIYEDKVIYIKAKAERIKTATVHEVGHVVDMLAGRASAKQEFRNIMDAEAGSLRSSTSEGDGHETSSAQEYFAECYSEYVLNGDSLKEQCPETYNYISGAVATL